MATHSSTLSWKIPWTEKPGSSPEEPSPWGHKESDMTDFTFFSLKKKKISLKILRSLKDPQALIEAWSHKSCG